MIEVEHLTRYFGDTIAVENVTFRVEKGEILGFLGPNAAGKTTTMRILTGFLPASRGTARVAGFDVFQNPLEVKQRIGYLPEHPPLYSEMTVYSYLDFIAKIKGIDSRDRSAKINTAIEKAGLDDRVHTIVKHLSKGYKQRLGIAQAIIHDPEVLILDEPTIGLDPKQIIEVRELIKSFAGNHTVILSTHILPEVSMTCERVVIIDKGRVVAEDRPENLTAKLKGSEQVTLVIGGPEQPVIECLAQVPGVIDVKIISKLDNEKATYSVENNLKVEVTRELAKAIVTNGWDLYELKKAEMSLEEIFLRLTTQEAEVSSS
ncbi:ABC transporter ATP-binding protein [candidate division KSB1 bacterium]|nr:ABC transporter ATP-binding protein [candidate division KSB1 bacterium]